MAAGIGRLDSYHNRFRTSSSTEANATANEFGSQNLPSVSENVDAFGLSPDFGQLSFVYPVVTEAHNSSNLIRHQQSQSLGEPIADSPSRKSSATQDPLRPMAPGKPRRLSRQTSADVKRQQYANNHSGSGASSVDSCAGDVFLDLSHGDLYDVKCLQSKRRDEPVLSTSSTASILPNPYNRINHRIHSYVWCCSCLYFVFFCCLPAIHYMEMSDCEHARGNVKRARTMGLASSFLFFTGSLLTLSLFALIFFLAIFFSVYK